jgi:hypothetical protein
MLHWKNLSLQGYGLAQSLTIPPFHTADDTTVCRLPNFTHTRSEFKSKTNIFPPRFESSRRFVPLVIDKRRLERLARAVLLQAIGKGESVVHLVVLEYVKTSIQRDFPAFVGRDVASM